MHFRTCCVKDCGNKFIKGGQLTFVKVPKDAKMRKLWLKICGIPGDRRRELYVCELHFAQDDSHISTGNPSQTLPSLNTRTSNVSKNNKSKMNSFNETCKIRPLILKTYSRDVPVLFLKPEENIEATETPASETPGDETDDVLENNSCKTGENENSDDGNCEFEFVLLPSSQQSSEINDLSPACDISEEISDDSSRSKDKEYENASTTDFQLIPKIQNNDNADNESENSSASDVIFIDEESSHTSAQSEIDKVENLKRHNEIENESELCHKCKKLNEDTIYYMKKINELEDENELLIEKNIKLKKRFQEKSLIVNLLRSKIRK